LPSLQSRVLTKRTLRLLIETNLLFAWGFGVSSNAYLGCTWFSYILFIRAESQLNPRCPSKTDEATVEGGEYT